MWNISMLKENAKRVLSGYYWIAVLASAIVMSLTGNLLSNLKQNDPVDVSDIAGSTTPSGSTDSEDIESAINDIFGGSSGSPDSMPSASEEFMEAFKKGFSASSGMDFDKMFGNTLDGIDVSDIRAVAAAIIGAAVVIIIVSMLIRVLYKLFLANPIIVGHNRFYLDARMGGPAVMRIFSPFQNGAYGNTVKTMFMYDFKLFLWSLIAFVPSMIFFVVLINRITSFDINSMTAVEDGLAFLGELIGMLVLWLVVYLICMIPRMIKGYSYALVPYLSAENPNLSHQRAFEISVQTMKGEKAHFFGLQMSFIGWYALASIAGTLAGSVSGILRGIVIVAGMAAIYPYVYATYAEFYCCMREKAAASGIASPEELCGGFGAEAAGIPYPGQQDYNNTAPYQRVDTNSSSSGSYPAYPGSGKMDTVDLPDDIPQEQGTGYYNTPSQGSGMEGISLDKGESGESDPDDPLG